jgi:hypothetical protein
MAKIKIEIHTTEDQPELIPGIIRSFFIEAEGDNSAILGIKIERALERSKRWKVDGVEAWPIDWL